MASSVSTPQSGDSPIVFQCGQCHRIVGDSCHWDQNEEDTNKIILTQISTEVLKSKKFHTSDEERDLGSTYYSLKCVCSSIIGKIYCTTPRHLDYLRDLYAFDADKITVYQVGSFGEGISVAPTATSGLTARVGAVEKRLSKIQEFILHDLSPRLKAIERCMDIQAVAADNDETNAEPAETEEEEVEEVEPAEEFTEDGDSIERVTSSAQNVSKSQKTSRGRGRGRPRKQEREEDSTGDEGMNTSSRKKRKKLPSYEYD